MGHQTFARLALDDIYRIGMLAFEYTGPELAMEWLEEAAILAESNEGNVINTDQVKRKYNVLYFY